MLNDALKQIEDDFEINLEVLVEIHKPLRANLRTLDIEGKLFVPASVVYKLDHLVYEYSKGYSNILKKFEHYNEATKLAKLGLQHKIELEDILRFLFKDQPLEFEQLLRIDTIFNELEDDVITKLTDVLTASSRQEITKMFYVKLCLYVRSGEYIEDLTEAHLEYVSEVTKGLFECLSN